MESRTEGAHISSAREPSAAPPDPGRSGRGEGLNVMVQAVTRSGGSFKIKCAAAADAVAVDEQFPLYEILEPYRTFHKELSFYLIFRSPC
ncbi:MAG: hypothetical protein ACOX33_02685 [Dethiobacteria bacterium]